MMCLPLKRCRSTGRLGSSFTYGDGVAYVSSQYVEVSLATGTGITVEEEQAIISKAEGRGRSQKSSGSSSAGTGGSTERTGSKL